MRDISALFVNICCCMICSGNKIFKELETQFSQTPTRPERVAADHIGYTGPRAIGGSLTDREFLSGSLSVFLNFLAGWLIVFYEILINEGSMLL